MCIYMVLFALSWWFSDLFFTICCSVIILSSRLLVALFRGGAVDLSHFVVVYKPRTVV
jgi:hypothetical protein